MTDRSAHDRFEELEAGRILGDLDEGEVREWESLSQTLGKQRDFTLELVAASIETEFLVARDEALPSSLAERIQSTAAPYVVSPKPSQDPGEAQESGKIVRPARWREILRSPELAWGLAALFAILLVANFFATRDGESRPIAFSPDDFPTSEPTQLISEKSFEAFKREAVDLLTVPLAGLPGFDDVEGKVLWSNARQEGYMLLSNMPVNNATRNQYQLWIVDPSRDDEPVDGGVFNVFPNDDGALIPIDSKVAVSDPQAFLITLEKPGGVVVSDQKVKVAAGAPS